MPSDPTNPTNPTYPTVPPDPTARVEPEDEGGDAPCWAHLFEDDADEDDADGRNDQQPD